MTGPLIPEQAEAAARAIYEFTMSGAGVTWESAHEDEREAARTVARVGLRAAGFEVTS